MGNTRLDEAQAGIKTARRNINSLRYADDTILMAESEEDLQNLFVLFFFLLAIYSFNTVSLWGVIRLILQIWFRPVIKSSRPTPPKRHTWGFPKHGSP